MKKFFITALVFIATTAAFAQRHSKSSQNPTPTQAKDTTSALTKALQNAPPPAKPVKPGKKDWSMVDLSKRAADHFMFELGYDNWANKPDSANIRGFNHSLNFYFMMDFPFKTDKRMSIGLGLGIGSGQIYFDRSYPLIADYNNPTLSFATTAGGSSAGGADHYKRFKLVTNYLEIPVELRFALDPEHMDKSWKFAVGTKIGYLIAAYTKSVDPEDVTNRVLAHVIEKESSKQYFSDFKFAPTLRVSKGVFGVFGQIQVNSQLNGSSGSSVFPFSAGVVLSGL
jgi:hypothetical protein